METNLDNWVTSMTDGVEQTYLVMVRDQDVSGVEGYKVVTTQDSIEKVAEKSVLEYIENYDDIGQKGKFVDECLIHFSDCAGCEDMAKVHEFGIEVRNTQFLEYDIDPSNYSEGIPIDVYVLNLEKHDAFKERLSELEANRLLKHVDTDIRREIQNIMYELSE